MSKLTEQLRKIKIFNAFMFAGCGNVYIDRMPGTKWDRARFEAVRPGFMTDPKGHAFKPNTSFAIWDRKQVKIALELAKDWVSKRYNITEWAKTPFGTWMDKGFVEKRLNELKEEIKREENLTNNTNEGRPMNGKPNSSVAKTAEKATAKTDAKAKEKKTKSSEYIGVSYIKRAKKFLASVRVGGKRIIAGYYKDPKEAAIARDAAARKAGCTDEKRMNFPNQEAIDKAEAEAKAKAKPESSTPLDDTIATEPVKEQKED